MPSFITRAWILFEIYGWGHFVPPPQAQELKKSLGKIGLIRSFYTDLTVLSNNYPRRALFLFFCFLSCVLSFLWSFLSFVLVLEEGEDKVFFSQRQLSNTAAYDAKGKTELFIILKTGLGILDFSQFDWLNGDRLWANTPAATKYRQWGAQQQSELKVFLHEQLGEKNGRVKALCCKFKLRKIPTAALRHKWKLFWSACFLRTTENCAEI